jgi:hypothetical protein
VALLVVFAVLLWYAFEGWVPPLARVPLVVVLAPVVVLAAAVVGTALSAALSGPYEPPTPTERRGGDLLWSPPLYWAPSVS